MPSRLVCEKCDSLFVYWDYEKEIFVCEKCAHYFLIKDLADQYMRIPTIPATHSERRRPRVGAERR